MAGAAQTPRSAFRSIALLVCMSVALAACGGSGDNETARVPQGSSPAPSPTPSPDPTPTPDPSPTPSPSPTPTDPSPAPSDPGPAPNPPTSPAPPPAPTNPSEPSPTPAPINAPPTISGVAASSVTANSLYTFTPAANDADGDTLAFQIENKPVWATFNTVTGRLSGTPTIEHEGPHPDIVIRVSDGKATVSLPAFTITVTAPASSNAATLSWTAPTQNEDGSALVNLAGYTIVYGPSSTMLHQTIRVENPGIDRYVIDDLPPGTYYFGIKAFNAEGAESALSNIVSKVIN